MGDDNNTPKLTSGVTEKKEETNKLTSIARMATTIKMASLSLLQGNGSNEFMIEGDTRVPEFRLSTEPHSIERLVELDIAEGSSKTFIEMLNKVNGFGELIDAIEGAKQHFKLDDIFLCVIPTDFSRLSPEYITFQQALLERQSDYCKLITDDNMNHLQKKTEKANFGEYMQILHEGMEVYSIGLTIKLKSTDNKSTTSKYLNQHIKDLVKGINRVIHHVRNELYKNKDVF